ncbi:26339_t:CDS:10 [Gigaspora rosea]|nr:26339_t:CDS:10 [Gigaspora rosea]
MIVKTTTLFKYEKPLSPHLAVDKNLIPKDDDVLLATKNHITECAIDASFGGGTLFLETAGVQSCLVNFYEKYFGELDGEFNNILEILENWHNERFNRLNEMAESSKDAVWWPFTQYEKIDKVNVIDSAYNDFMVIYDNDQNCQSNQNYQGEKKSKNDGIMKEMFDASSSWWTQGLGHGSSKLSLSASYAAGRYGHVLFPECIHEPALSLSQTLLKTVGNNWATRVFFSDNGSTAVEVALKMALQSACKRYFNDQDDEFQKIKILGLYGSYHGDTIGKWFQPPRILLKNNVYNLQIPFSNQTIQYPSLSSIFSPKRSISDPVSLIYKNHIKETITRYIIEGNKFGALLFEPIVMGAGGLPIIFDEVFTGFWRLGQLSGANVLGVSKIDSLLHGHSYTAHPIGCMVANTSLEEYENLIKVSNDWKIGRENWNVNKENQFWSMWSKEVVGKISCMENVEGVFALGSLLAIELKDVHNSDL